MRIKSSFNLAAALLLLCLSAFTAAAQTTQANGKVTLRQTDGTEVPVPDATITFYRTDIAGKYEVKTNKKGEYVRLGMPFGTFTIAVNAPNAQPTYSSGIRLSQKPENNFVLSPGNGRVITLDEIKAAAANPTAGGAPAAPVDNAEARKRAEEIARANAEIDAKNARATELNAKLPQILKTGNDAFNSKNYDAAIAAYDQGITADPEQGVFHLNKSAALRGRGVDRYNEAVKSKNQAGRATAQSDLKAAVEASEKAVAAYRAAPAKQGATAAPAGGGKSTELLSALASRAETYRLAMRIGMTESADAAATAMQEYIAAETDASKKGKFEITLADALRDSGQVDKAVATYRRLLAADPNNIDAVFGLGMALQFDEAKLTANAPEVITLMKQVLAKDTSGAGDRKQAATDSITSMENLIQQSKQGTDSKPRNTRRRGN